MAADQNLEQLAEAALQFIQDGFVVGLGSGRAAARFVHALGTRVQKGLRVRGVPTSNGTAKLAMSLGIPLVGFDEIDTIDIDVDGADEVDPQMNLIKGLGGALLREKIVASASKRLIVLVGEEKLVPVLGSHGILPIEVVPFGLPLCQRRLAELGYPSTVRVAEGKPFVTDNGNAILDCKIAPLAAPATLDQTLRAIPGILETGLFLGRANIVLVQKDGVVKQLGS